MGCVWLLLGRPQAQASSRLEFMWSNASGITFGRTCRLHVQEPSESLFLRDQRQAFLAARSPRHYGHPYLHFSSPKRREGMLVKVCRK